MKSICRFISCVLCFASFIIMAEDQGLQGLYVAEEMTLVPEGDFMMGSDGGTDDERPAHKVFLKAFYMDKFEVTNAEYHKFWLADGGADSRHTPNSFSDEFGEVKWPEVAIIKPNYPVVGVSWFDAEAYAKWAKKRLPTEAEWEKASRGVDGRFWPWGNSFDLKISSKTSHANVWNGSDRYDNFLSPVGSYPTGKSPYGTMDMSGNVWEWSADWYDNAYYVRSEKSNPKGPKIGCWKTLRGGSWINNAESTLTLNRWGAYPSMKTNFVGFRTMKEKER